MDRQRHGLWVFMVIAFVVSAFVISNRTVLSEAYRAHRTAVQNEERERKAILEHNSKNCYAITYNGARMGPVIKMEEASFGQTRLFLAGGAVSKEYIKETVDCK